jgi:hypothetical protein
MPSISETGHAKNVANFQELISFCESYGTAYNPNKDSLKIENLRRLLQEARDQLDTVIKKVTTFNNAVTVRQNTFANIKPLFTKVVNAFAVTNAPDQTIAEIKALNKKIQGTSSKKKTTTTTTTDNTTTPDAKTISTSQQSYDSITEHHAKVISLLNAESSYQPNETELQIKSLTELLDAMKNSTKEVTITFAEVSNARIARNEIFYKENTGLYDTAMDVKKYIKSIFGATSPQLKQVSGIKFTKVK